MFHSATEMFHHTLYTTGQKWLPRHREYRRRKTYLMQYLARP